MSDWWIMFFLVSGMTSCHLTNIENELHTLNKTMSSIDGNLNYIGGHLK